MLSSSKSTPAPILSSKEGIPPIPPPPIIFDISEDPIMVELELMELDELEDIIEELDICKNFHLLNLINIFTGSQMLK